MGGGVPMTKSDLVDIACTLRHETSLAWFLDVGYAQPVWIPKSQAEYESDPTGGCGIITLPNGLRKRRD